MKLPIDKEWFEKRAAAEGDCDPTTGRRKTMTLNLTDDEIAELERLANPSCDAIRAQAFEEAARIADEFASADLHLRDLARKDRDGTSAFVHAAEAATGQAIARAIRAKNALPPAPGEEA